MFVSVFLSENKKAIIIIVKISELMLSTEESTLVLSTEDSI